MDFPKLLAELYKSSFTAITVSGGFRRSGVWPHNPNAMKEKVIRRPLSINHAVSQG
jgi:hypothetical protein